MAKTVEELLETQQILLAALEAAQQELAGLKRRIMELERKFPDYPIDINAIDATDTQDKGKGE